MAETFLSWRKKISTAATLDELQGTLASAYSFTEGKLLGTHRADASIKKKKDWFLRAFNKRKNALTKVSSTATEIVTGPKTLDNVYNELLKQGLQLVGLGQQVQSSAAGQTVTAQSASGSKGPDFGKWLLIGGAVLVGFYFFKRG